MLSFLDMARTRIALLSKTVSPLENLTMAARRPDWLSSQSASTLHPRWIRRKTTTFYRPKTNRRIFEKSPTPFQARLGFSALWSSRSVPVTMACKQSFRILCNFHCPREETELVLLEVQIRLRVLLERDWFSVTLLSCYSHFWRKSSPIPWASPILPPFLADGENTRYLVPIYGGYLADTKLGRFKTILIGMCSSHASMMLYHTLSLTIPI